MNESTVLFEIDGMELLAMPAGGPRGARLSLRVGDKDDEREVVLLEGQAKRLHLAIRQWIRRQKSLRGDTPRGERAFELLDRQYRRPRSSAGAEAAS
jgi:hypothetical protein